METLISTLNGIAISSPVIIVWVIGIALALSRWRVHPRVSQFALIACAVSIVNTVVGRFLNAWLSITMRDSGWKPSQIGLIFFAIGIGAALISAVAWAMVLYAVFGWRDGRQKEDFPPPPPTFADEPREQNTTS